MVEVGWRGYTEQEFQMALFVRDKVFRHYGVSGEDQTAISETLGLLALYHLRDQRRVVLKAELQDLFPGFSGRLPDQRQAEATVKAQMQKYGVSQPLTELLYAVLLVEITYWLVSEKKLIWLAAPSARSVRA